MGNAANPPTIFSASGSNLNLKNNHEQDLGPIPAFGYAEFELSGQTKSLFESFDETLIIKVGDKEYPYIVSVRPFVIFQTWPIMIGVVIGVMVLVYISILGWFIYKRRLLKILHKK